MSCRFHKTTIPVADGSQGTKPVNMKATAFLALVGLFGANLHGVAASPTVKISRADSVQSWEFSLYQNARCTGAQDQYSGNGTSTCRHDIRHGGALGFIRDRVSRGCTITLFEGQNCTHPIQNITSRTPETCMHPPSQLSSFNVHCLRPHFMYAP